MASQADSLSQPVTSDGHSQFTPLDWNHIDDKFHSIVTPIQARLGSDVILAVEAGELFSQLLADHLANRGVIKGPNNQSNHGRHRQRVIVRLTNRLVEPKNASRKTFQQNPSEFLTLVRAHNKARKPMTDLDKARSARRKERDFRSNPWKFAKSICQGKSEIQPSFSKEECLSYFTAQYSSPSSHYQCLPAWISQVMPTPDEVSDFNLSPITPRHPHHQVQTPSRTFICTVSLAPIIS